MPMIRTRLLGQAFARLFLPLLLVLSLAPCVASAAPGDLDPSFGIGGKVTTDFGVLGQATAVAVQADGKIVAAGTFVADPLGGRDRIGLVRYNADGSLDTGFGTGGRVAVVGGFEFSTSDPTSPAPVIQPDGKLVAAAGARRGFGLPFDFALARYNPAGAPDQSFGQ